MGDVHQLHYDPDGIVVRVLDDKPHHVVVDITMRKHGAHRNVHRLHLSEVTATTLAQRLNEAVAMLREREGGE
jgi:hypothetical protein